MADIHHEWREDLQWSPTGDLLTAEDGDFVRQRIERRLFTAVRGYVWHTEYGAGLPQKIGGLFQPYQIASLVRAQLALEDSVAQNPPPRVRVSEDRNNPGMQIVRIDYHEAPSGRQIGLTLSF